METAFGVLNWTPDVFWNAAPRELNSAIEGYKKMNSSNDNINTSNSLVSSKDIENMQELLRKDREQSK